MVPVSPVTAFEWCHYKPEMLVSACLESVCTLWDIEKMAMSQQWIAHEGPVNSVCFAHDEHTLLTGGGDGSVRLFDLRNNNYFSDFIDPRNCPSLKTYMPVMRVVWNLNSQT